MKTIIILIFCLIIYGQVSSQTNYDSLKLKKREFFTIKSYDSSKRNLEIKDHPVFLNKRNVFFDSTRNNFNFEEKRTFANPSLKRREDNNN